MSTIKCGIIGIGWMGLNHLINLQNNKFAEVVAICRRNKDELNKIAIKYNVKKTYSNYEELIADKEIDMVIISTPVKQHREQTIKALNSGKHVFLETPMASSVRECDEMIEVLEKNQKIFMVGHICRFDSLYSITREKIKKGEIGEVLSIHAWRNQKRIVSENNLEYTGPFFGDGIHDLDIAIWYLESKPKNVFARTIKTRKYLNFDDLGWAVFTFENDSLVIIENIWCLPNSVNFPLIAGMKVVGTSGQIIIDNTGSNFRIYNDNGVFYPEHNYWPMINNKITGYLKEEVDYFIDCVLNNIKPAIIKPNEARNVINYMRLAEKSAEEKMIIAID
jgi:UDP-N-acetylglucosamine 3-dehydrogenase